MSRKIVLSYTIICQHTVVYSKKKKLAVQLDKKIGYTVSENKYNILHYKYLSFQQTNKNINNNLY